MRKGKNTSQYQAFANLLKEFQKKFSGLKEEEAEKKFRLIIIQYVGDFTKAYYDLAINPTADDLALMTSEVKVLCSVAGIYLTCYEFMKDDAKKIVSGKITDAEKSLQRYFAYKAKGLKGGKTGNKLLIDLIEANTPK